jgi:hypothetical protein
LARSLSFEAIADTHHLARSLSFAGDDLSRWHWPGGSEMFRHRNVPNLHIDRPRGFDTFVHVWHYDQYSCKYASVSFE